MEKGPISLDDLRETKGAFVLPVERDVLFERVELETLLKRWEVQLGYATC